MSYRDVLQPEKAFRANASDITKRYCDPSSYWEYKLTLSLLSSDKSSNATRIGLSNLHC